MKAFFLILFLCVAGFTAASQSEKTISGDTTFWRKTWYEIGDKAKLTNLIRSKEKFYFRFWTSGKIIDIWTNDSRGIKGVITIYTRQIHERKHKDTQSKYIVKQIAIDSTSAEKVYRTLTKINDIPSDHMIKGWKQGLDGIEYTVEISTPSTYTFKNYWTPTAQDSTLIEAKIIQSFIVGLDTLLNLKDKYQRFFNELKPGTYSYGSMTMMTKFSSRINRYLQKTAPDRKYLNSVSDSLNHYLTDTLTKIFSKYGTSICYTEFILTFSKENKLISVRANGDLDDKEEKKEFKAYKKKIFDAFKQINVNFVYSKINYTRGLSFNGHPEIFNHTIF